MENVIPENIMKSFYYGKKKDKALNGQAQDNPMMNELLRQFNQGGISIEQLFQMSRNATGGTRPYENAFGQNQQSQYGVLSPLKNLMQASPSFIPKPWE